MQDSRPINVIGLDHLSFMVSDLGKFVSKFRYISGIEPERPKDDLAIFRFSDGTFFQVRKIDPKLTRDRRYNRQDFKPAIVISDHDSFIRALKSCGLPYSVRKGERVIDFTVCDVLFHTKELQTTALAA